MTESPETNLHFEAVRISSLLEVDFPELSVSVRSGTICIHGEFQIVDGGRVIDLYDIEITVAPGRLRALPTLREVGGRIPRTLDNHMNSDGTACVGVPDELFYRSPLGFDLLGYLKGPVLAYFTGQSLVQRGEKWPYGEYGHGVDGRVEFYGGLLRTNDPQQVSALLTMLVAPRLRSKRLCPCGSGQKIRDFHWGVVTALRARVPRSLLRDSQAIVAAFHPKPSR